MIRTSIICSLCGTEGIVSYGPRPLAAHRLRSQLREKGWGAIQMDGPHDVCPECREGRTLSSIHDEIMRRESK